MHIAVDARSFLDLLKKFKPRRKIGGLHESHVQASAGGSAIVLQGTFENSASLAATVKASGNVSLPLESTMQLLKLHKKGDVIEIKSDGKFIWIGPVKFPLRS